MNTIINKYLYSVTRRCSANKRDEIKNELESNIYDMLPNNPTDQEIDAVLHKIGNPIYVAAKYQDEEQHVVSPIFYQDYIMILKVTLLGFGTLSILLSIIQAFTIDTTILNFWETLGEVGTYFIDNLSSFLFFIFTAVTLVFWSFNHPKIKVKIDNWLNNWKVSELMDVPETEKENKPQGRWSIFFSMFFTTLLSVFFAVIFIFHTDMISLYDNGTRIAAVFGDSMVDVFTWPIIISVAMNFIYYMFYLKAGKTNVAVLIFYTLNSLFSAVIALWFINSPDLFSSQFVTGLTSLINISFDDMSNMIRLNVQVLSILTIIGTTIDILSRWYKLLFKSKKTKTIAK